MLTNINRQQLYRNCLQGNLGLGLVDAKCRQNPFSSLERTTMIDWMSEGQK